MAPPKTESQWVAWGNKFVTHAVNGKSMYGQDAASNPDHIRRGLFVLAMWSREHLHAVIEGNEHKDALMNDYKKAVDFFKTKPNDKHASEWKKYQVMERVENSSDVFAAQAALRKAEHAERRAKAKALAKAEGKQRAQKAKKAPKAQATAPTKGTKGNKRKSGAKKTPVEQAAEYQAPSAEAPKTKTDARSRHAGHSQSATAFW